MGVSERLAELGIILPDVVPPVASYVPAVRTGNLVMTSGQLPMSDGALASTGKVGEGVDLVPPADAAGLARLCALNAVAAAASLMGGVDNLTRVVKVVGFVASDRTFTGQPAVINGASNLLQEIFGDAGVHARSAVGVAALPLDAPVEVEVTFEVA
ncbi:RidA family protein [Pseudactinotalea terrae]|uniref:RidA family protein n=1 Tax=Pseudactinotalea terrae TaxID=1743262 RepID=UPI0012E2F6E5|nr:RidA family protein [Pseudactinotalea terrae]